MTTDRVDENLRLRHRTLDLRRTPMREALELRHRVVQTIRAVLDVRDFLEIETPVPDALDARGRARLPGARPHRAGLASTRCRSPRSCSSSC